MRIADPADLTAEPSLESVMTATMPRHVANSLVQAMRDVDVFNSPGPAKMAVLELDAGPKVAVVYHEIQNLLEILAPVDHTTEQALAEVVDVLRIPQTSIEWVREGIALSRVYHDGGPPPIRCWRVIASPALAEQPLSASESISLTFLVSQLRYVAGEIAPIPGAPVRVIQLPDTILFEDGSEAAPLAVYFTISDDGSTASIVKVEHLAGEKMRIASGTLLSAIEAAVT